MQNAAAAAARCDDDGMKRRMTAGADSTCFRCLTAEKGFSLVVLVVRGKGQVTMMKKTKNV